MIEEKIGIAIIGGGSAGLAAAIAAKENGLGSIMILERNEELGGILPQCIHTGFGLQYYKENLTGPEFIQMFIDKTNDLGIKYKLKTMVLDISRKKRILAVNQFDGLIKLYADAIILAMGCRERSRGSLCIPGTRPAGIFTAGAAQRMLDIDGYIPGKKILILGSGDVGLIMARRFAMEGAEVMGVVETMPFPGGLERNLQCLRDFNIPLFLRHEATFINGFDRVEAVTISKIDDAGLPIEGAEKVIECDTLILSVGLTPENELSKKASVKIDHKTGGPLVNENMETSVENIFACGNVVHVHDLVDHVAQDGEIAGKNASNKVLNKLPALKKRIFLRSEGNIRYVVPQIISGEIPVNIYLRVKKPAYNVDISLGKNIILHERVIKPAELVKISLQNEELNELGEEEELIVRMTHKEA